MCLALLVGCALLLYFIFLFDDVFSQSFCSFITFSSFCLCFLQLPTGKHLLRHLYCRLEFPCCWSFAVLVVSGSPVPDLVRLALVGSRWFGEEIDQPLTVASCLVDLLYMVGYFGRPRFPLVDRPNDVARLHFILSNWWGGAYKWKLQEDELSNCFSLIYTRQTVAWETGGDCHFQCDTAAAED